MKEGISDHIVPGSTEGTIPIPPEVPKGGRNRLHLTIWAAADKALPMIYGVAVVVIPLGQGLLDKHQWGIWTVFQMLFLIISLLGDFFLLQPMVKLCTEHNAQERPIITAAAALYTGLSLLLTLPVALAPEVFAPLFKIGIDGQLLLSWMLLTVASTIVRNIAIRILQIDYRITKIFLLDLAYFGGFVAMMLYGWANGSFGGAEDMIYYNLIALTASSVTGLVLCARELVPSFAGTLRSVRRIVEIGIHQGGTGLMTIVQQHGDTAIVSGTRGSVAVGIYNAARIFFRVFEALRDAGQLLLVPVTSHAYSQNNREKVQDITVLATAALVLLLYPVTLILILTAPIFIPMILKDYASATDEFQWLMASGFAMPFIIVPSAVLLGIGHTRDLFRGMLIGTVVLIGGGLVLTYRFGEVGMAAGVLLGNGTIAVLLTRRMNRYIHFSVRQVLHRSRRLGALARERARELRATFGRNSS